MASKRTEVDDGDDDFPSNTDIQRDSIFSSITPFSRGNQSGRSERGDLNDENPFITLLSLMQYPKTQKYGERGKSRDREFDNGYSYTAKNVTEDSSDSKKPVMQLLEKKSARTPTYLRGVWNEEKIDLVKKGEIVIQNTFLDLEDGENGTNHPEIGELSTERADTSAYEPDIKTDGTKQLEHILSLIFQSSDQDKKSQNISPDTSYKKEQKSTRRSDSRGSRRTETDPNQSTRRSDSSGSRCTETDPNQSRTEKQKSTKRSDSSGPRCTETDPNQSRILSEKRDASNQPVLEQCSQCVSDKPQSPELFNYPGSTDNSRLSSQVQKDVHRSISNEDGVDSNDNTPDRISDDTVSDFESKERKSHGQKTRDSPLTDNTQEPGKLSPGPQSRKLMVDNTQKPGKLSTQSRELMVDNTQEPGKLSTQSRELIVDNTQKPGKLSTKSRELMVDTENEIIKEENQKQRGISTKILHQNSLKDSTTDHIPSDVKQQTFKLLDLLNESSDEGGINYFLSDDDEDDGYLGITMDSLPTETLEWVSKQLSSHGYATHDGRYSEGRNQFYNMPTFYHSIRKFAEDNGFETADSKQDGNCMFEAVSDQLVANGEFGLTLQDIRSQAVQYLRENPFHNDGSHLESFLSKESWDMYLRRMERNYQWGDHMILTAIANALKLHIFVFNVYEDDIRQTEIEPNNPEKTRLLTIYLGHIGEFHYMSLRRTNWEHLWPYKALIRRIHYCCPQESSERVQQKIKQMGLKKYIEDAGILPQESSHCTQETGDVKITSTDCLPHYRGKFNTYGLKLLQLEETDDSLETLVSDERYIDVVTGLPIPHLSYVIRQLLSANLIKSYKMKNEFSEIKVSGVTLRTEFKGPMFENSNVALFDHSKTKSMSKFNNLQQYNKASVFYIYMDFVIGYSSHKYSILDTSADIFADSTSVHQGYCRLRPSVLRQRNWGQQIVHIGQDAFIKGFDMRTGLVDGMKKQFKKVAYGYNCATFPPCTREWQCRKRPSNWPNVEVLEEVKSAGCVLIQSAHSKSTCPNVEWKYDFFRADQIIFRKGLTPSQMQVFQWYKLIIMYMTMHLDRPLKNKHIKSVFLYACEIIPVESWQTKAGACLLYLFGSLQRFLKRRNIPHYFVSSCNMLDDYSTEEVATISTYVEAFRVFPVISLQFIMNRYGYGKGNVIRISSSVLKDSQRFATDYDLTRVILRVFIPTSIRRVRRLAKKEFYEAAYKVIKDAHEELLSIQWSAAGQPNFEDFFRYVLNKVKDQTNCQELISMFENETGVNVDGIHIEQIRVKDLVPWKLDDNIGNMLVPEANRKDLVSVAKFIDLSALSSFMKLDFTGAVLRVKTAVKIIQSLLLDNSINPNEIVDLELKSVIRKEKASLIHTLKYHYDNLLFLCDCRKNYEPLREHISELERILQQHPNVSSLIEEIQYCLNYGSPKQRRDYSNARYPLELD